MVNSLLTAIVRADGDALVMHVGEQPYVVAASGPVELSSRPLTLEAVAGMLGQLLPADTRRALDELGAIEHELPKSSAAEGERFTVVAARGGDDIWIEIRRHRVVAVAPAEPAVAAVDAAKPVVASAPATPVVEEPVQAPPAPAPAPSPAVAHVTEPRPPAGPVREDLTVELEEPEAASLPSPADDLVPFRPAPDAVAVSAPLSVAVSAAPATPVSEPEPTQAVASVPTAVPPSATPAGHAAAAVPAQAAAAEAAVAPAPKPAAAADPAAEIPAPVHEPAAALASASAAPSAALRAPAHAPVLDPLSAPHASPAVAAAPSHAVDQAPSHAAPRARVAPPARNEFSSIFDAPSAALPTVPAGSASAQNPVPALSSAPARERYVAPRPAPVERTVPAADPVAPVLPSPALERFAALRSVRAADTLVSPASDAMNEFQDQVPSQAEPSQAVVLPLARNPVRPELAPAKAAPPPRIAGLDRLLRLAAARGATTIYLMSDARPSIRVDGEIAALDGEPALTASEVESLLLDMAPERNRAALRAGEGTEWMSEVADVGRFRCQSFQDHRGPGGIFRMISSRPTSVEQLGLSREIQALCAETEGLVLVAGPRSSGKSTLISAFVDLINRTRNDYVITLESQIASTHESRGSLISQREVRGNGDEWAAAVRAAVRENPDVLVIEDLRSPKVLMLALEAMEKGHLVIGAMSAHTATTAIGRILDQCPPDRREQVQLMLAEGLRGVVSQVLLKKSGGGRVAAREVLLNTSAIASLIAEGRIGQLPLALDSGRKHGMVPLNDALAGFVQSGIVDVKDAYRQAFERQAFLAVLRREGVDTSFVERLA